MQNTASQAINIIDNVVIERDNLQSELRKAMNKTGESFCEGEGDLANEIGVHLEELHSEIEDMVQAIEDSIVVSWASECGMLLSSVFCCPLTTSLLLYYSEFWQ